MGIEKAKSAEITQSLIFVASAIFGEGNKNKKPSSSVADLYSVLGQEGVSVVPNNDKFNGLDEIFDKM